VNRIFCDFGSVSESNKPSPIQLDNLWQLRTEPRSSSSNCRLDSPDVLLHELESAPRTIVVDMTVAEKRDVSGLLKLSESLHSSCVVCSTGPLAHKAFLDSTITDIVSTMILEITHGVDILDDRGISAQVKVGAIALCILGTDVLSPRDLKGLRAVGAAHSVLISRHGSAPPTCVEMQPFTATHSEALQELAQAGAVMSRVVLCRNVLSLASVDYFADILQTYSDMSLCFDSFGTVETPASGPMYPTDAESIEALRLLLERGWASRVIVSVHVRYKMDLCTYGGWGYAHISRSVIPRMRHMGVTEEHIQDITSRNASKVITWYTPPPPKPIEVETVPCHICGTRFVLGEHYEKFNFVYCSSKCLATHRKRNWSTVEPP
jgi:phosphotriesterase-related protein